MFEIKQIWGIIDFRIGENNSMEVNGAPDPFWLLIIINS